MKKVTLWLKGIALAKLAGSPSWAIVAGATVTGCWEIALYVFIAAEEEDAILYQPSAGVGEHRINVHVRCWLVVRK